MACSGMYCPYCECVRSEEPCIDCIESKCQCKGECICCAGCRTNNTLKIFSERKEVEEPIVQVIEDGNNGLEVKMQYLTVQSKREFHFLGPFACISEQKNQLQSTSSTDTNAGSPTENEKVKQIGKETHATFSESRMSDDECFDSVSQEVKGCADLAKEEFFENSESAEKLRHLRASRKQQMVSMTSSEITPQESKVDKNKERKPNQCDGCSCLPGHVSCIECIHWDFTCTYPMQAMRCTCCDDFENLLDQFQNNCLETD